VLPGRPQIALGAGWNKPGHDATGLPFEPVGVRIRRLAEAITILKGCFADVWLVYAGQGMIASRLRAHARKRPPARPPAVAAIGEWLRPLTS
jgi:alkanesulfonate monooxygenase SsuD/methylene tetrahydromethanopterin reductase-like flavin-dependent oxidoreductase (luciferase family)